MSKGSIAAPKDQGKWKNSFGNTLFQEWEGCDLEPGLTSATHMTVGNYPTHPLSTHLSIHPSTQSIIHHYPISRPLAPTWSRASSWASSRAPCRALRMWAWGNAHPACEMLTGKQPEDLTQQGKGCDEARDPGKLRGRRLHSRWGRWSGKSEELGLGLEK